MFDGGGFIWRVVIDVHVRMALPNLLHFVYELYKRAPLRLRIEGPNRLVVWCDRLLRLLFRSDTQGPGRMRTDRLRNRETDLRVKATVMQPNLLRVMPATSDR